MSNEILFVQEIEKRECLYNYNLPEYNRKDLTDEAWSEVATSRNLTVNECKEKWRNIRSSFLRSMKKSEKVKKPYYLSPYLQFVVPFTKLSQTDFIDETHRSNSQIYEENDPDSKISTVKSETDRDEEQEPTHFEIVDVQRSETDLPNENTKHRRSHNVHKTRRKRRQFFSNDKKSAAFKKRHQESSANSHLSTSLMNNSSMRYFLLSLLPDFQSMTSDQIMSFKIKVMMLIDDIKSNFTEVRESLNTSKESDRLQKRLINLLLKNLKKK